MGYTSIIMLTLALSFALQIGAGYHTPLTAITEQYFGSTYNPTTQNFESSGSGTNLATIAATIVAGAGLVVLTGLFPNPYGIFSLLFAGLLTFISFPIEVITSAQLPGEVKLFLGSTFGVLIILAWVFSYKGGGD